MNNISDVLWDSECTGVEEYICRRWFYGNLNKLSDRHSDDIEYREDVLRKAESLQSGIPDYSVIGKGGVFKLEVIGWKELYSHEERAYLRNGVKSFKIYDN